MVEMIEYIGYRGSKGTKTSASPSKPGLPYDSTPMSQNSEDTTMYAGKLHAHRSTYSIKIISCQYNMLADTWIYLCGEKADNASSRSVDKPQASTHHTKEAMRRA
jgi:hypothetical protein